jgi:hypothetical protein
LVHWLTFILGCCIAFASGSTFAADGKEPRSLANASDSLPSPWNHQDIGAVEVKGSASFDKSVFTIKGTLDTWGTNDGFHFVWQPFRGDGQIVARVLSVENTMNHAKAGVMLRETLAAEAKHAEACVTPVDGTQFPRSRRNGWQDNVRAHWQRPRKTSVLGAPRAYRRQVHRLRIRGWRGLDAHQFDEHGDARSDLRGLVTSSHQKAVLCTATLDKVAVSRIFSATR